MTLFYYAFQQFNTEWSTKMRLSRIDARSPDDDLSLAFNERGREIFPRRKNGFIRDA